MNKREFDWLKDAVLVQGVAKQIVSGIHWGAIEPTIQAVSGLLENLRADGSITLETSGEILDLVTEQITLDK